MEARGKSAGNACLDSHFLLDCPEDTQLRHAVKPVSFSGDALKLSGLVAATPGFLELEMFIGAITDGSMTSPTDRMHLRKILDITWSKYLHSLEK